MFFRGHMCTIVRSSNLSLCRKMTEWQESSDFRHGSTIIFVIPSLISAGPNQLSGGCDQIRILDFCSRACWWELILLQPWEHLMSQGLISLRNWEGLKGVIFCCFWWWTWRLWRVVRRCPVIRSMWLMVCYVVLMGSSSVDGDAKRDGCRCCRALCYRVLLQSRVSCVSCVS